jgi:hypothetical protein
MTLFFVTPAWRRFAVTRLALAQRRQLVDDLAARGVTADCVVIADDENLDIAREFGFPVVEMDNSQLGRKFNAGIQYAAAHGADFISAIGSDNWVHPDFITLPPPDEPKGKRLKRPPVRSVDAIVTGRLSFIVDLEVGVGRRIRGRGTNGIIPWIIPRRLLERRNFAPIIDGKMSGIDHSLAMGVRAKPSGWYFHDPHDLCRVGWKSGVDLTLYDGLARNLGYGQEESDPFAVLATKYPADLIELARETHKELAA